MKATLAPQATLMWRRKFKLLERNWRKCILHMDNRLFQQRYTVYVKYVQIKSIFKFLLLGIWVPVKIERFACKRDTFIETLSWNWTGLYVVWLDRTYIIRRSTSVFCETSGGSWLGYFLSSEILQLSWKCLRGFWQPSGKFVSRGEECFWGILASNWKFLRSISSFWKLLIFTERIPCNTLLSIYQRV